MTHVRLTVGRLVEPLTGRYWDAPTVTREVAAWSARLMSRGLRPGDRVFLHSANRLEFFAALLAVWRLGGCAVPVDPRLTRVEVERLVEVASPRLSVIDDDVDATALPAAVTVVNAREDAGPGELSADLARPHDDALILFTSGSSGAPKGVVHTHASLEARWAALRRHLGLAAYARTLCLLPTHFGHGLICNCLFPWLGGQDLFITQPFRPDLLARLGALIDEHRITFLSSVPAVWRLALKIARPPRKAALERVHCGSAPLPATLWEGIRGWAGTKEVFNTYGLTETGSWVAGTSDGPFTPADGLIGIPWGATIRVRRAADAEGLAALGDGECAPGETGHVWLETPALMRGYLGRDDLTRRVVVDGRFATGDLGALDERGWLHLRGRERDEINKGGMKIAPAEIDAAAEGCPSVAEACAFALDDPLYGQNVGLAVTVTGEGDQALADVYRWMRERLAETKLPARWWRLDAMPRSDRGKVSREAVRDACAARPPLDLTRILQGR
ncbi:MAG TPA: class I adenylate-forming enzyme family protein [Methylomirabilota bacterium]